MKFEHVAYPMEDPIEAAKWYEAHLGMKIRRGGRASPFAHFLADASGRAMVEIYNNPRVKAPAYRAMDPLLFHLAFTTEDVPAARARLIEAGARPEGEVERTPAGDELAMLRDPWGVPIQLAKRAEPML